MQTDQFGGASVSVGCRNDRRRIERFSLGVEPQTVSKFRVYAKNTIDRDKLAGALSHLVSILGATKEAF